MYYGEIWMVHKSALEERTPIVLQEKTVKKSRPWAVSFRFVLFENFKKKRTHKLETNEGDIRGSLARMALNSAC